MKRLFDKDTWQEIFGSIQKNKIRTIITMIGVLWGIFIYITLSGSSKGLDNGFERQFQSIASNSIFIWAQSTSIPYAGYKSERNITLKIQDADILKKKVKNIKFIAPRIVAGIFGSAGGSIVRGTKTGTYSIYGEYPEYIKIATSKIYEGGRFINESDIQSQRKVCVIGERTQLELFEEDEDPIGKYISINKINFKVVGVHKFVQGGGFGDDGDIYIPFTTFKKIFNTGDDVGFFVIAADENADGVIVEKDIKATLKQIHKIHPNDERAIGGFNLGEIFRKTMNFANGLTFLSLVVGIATILAGIIGIGNILLISVKERTKEIGIRRALGATPKSIRQQIVLESVFLTTVAGMLGIIFGAFVLFLIDMAFGQGEDAALVNPTVNIPIILIAFVTLIALGTAIGLIPAHMATVVKPIEALREE